MRRGTGTRSACSGAVDHGGFGVDHDIPLQGTVQHEPGRPERQYRTERQMENIHLQAVAVLTIGVVAWSVYAVMG